MGNRLTELYLQRGRLLERIAAQRRTLARQAAPLRTACDTTDRVLGLVREAGAFVQRHPVAVAATATALLVIRPRWAWRWLRRGFLLWRGWRGLRRVLARLHP
jgi:hypothetical protein